MTMRRVIAQHMRDAYDVMRYDGDGSERVLVTVSLMRERRYYCRDAAPFTRVITIRRRMVRCSRYVMMSAAICFTQFERCALCYGLYSTFVEASAMLLLLMLLIRVIACALR